MENVAKLLLDFIDSDLFMYIFISFVLSLTIWMFLICLEEIRE